MSYKAFVSHISVRPHPNADRLQVGECGGYQVLVGKDVQDGQLGLFFEAGGQLSEEFAQANDLVRRKDADGKTAGGMFEPNRRVKSITLRGVRSEGFWCPLSMLDFADPLCGGKYPLSAGDQLDEWCGRKICQRYETPATRMGMRQHKPQKSNPMFHKHIDTKQWRRSKSEIPDGALCIVSEKLHGTSFRYGRVLVDVPVKRGAFGRLVARLLGWPTTKKQWGYLHGSRNVVLEDNGMFDGYYKGDFRRDAMKGVVLHKGEVLYGELVGWAGEKPIMSPHNIEKEAGIGKRFRSPMVYSYGCQKGQCKPFIYRITMVNEDGIPTELSWMQVKQRCLELGLEYVPQLAILHSDDSAFDTAVMEYATDNVSTLDDRHIMEGIVVRHESSLGTGWLKQKTNWFCDLEGIAKNDDTYVDTEEAS